MTAARRTPAATLRRWTLRARVGRVVLAALVLLGILLSIVAISFDTFIGRGDDVIKRWAPAEQLSQSLLFDLVNQETGVRGYALTGDVSFLEPYEQYRTQQAVDEKRLRGLLPSHPELLAELNAFDLAAATWSKDIAVPFIARVQAHDPGVATAAGGVEAKDRFDAVRSRSASLSAGIEVVRRQAGQARRDALHYVWAALAVTAALMLGVFWVVWQGLRRAVLDPIEQLAVQTQLVAAGNTGQPIVPHGPPELAALGADVDAMRARIVDELAVVERARQDLLARTDALARSNADLEQFAYVASHDLSEPLRKVANFCQLLERQYGDQLDDKARQYIGFAVDGAKRMQVLISDLLAFSRVGRTTAGFVTVELDAMLDRALDNLTSALSAAGATVHRDPLPTVQGDPTLLTALLQNLVGNAIKYRSDAAPVVTITAQRSGAEWEISVRDNGIGVEPQYAERIFAIFQRLHLRDEYEGTGIGLALCRKIVEFHAGRIWLNSTIGPGATFTFTIPDGVDPQHGAELAEPAELDEPNEMVGTE